MNKQNKSKSRDIPFAHPSEEEFSRILDFYKIKWEYEPKTFTLRRDDKGQVTEAFTPDFYLSEYDMYIELTTLRQKLIGKKHRKIRRLQELYPNVHVKLVNRRAFGELLIKYGLQDQEDELVGQAALEQSDE